MRILTRCPVSEDGRVVALHHLPDDPLARSLVHLGLGGQRAEGVVKDVLFLPRAVGSEDITAVLVGVSQHHQLRGGEKVGRL